MRYRTLVLVERAACTLVLVTAGCHSATDASDGKSIEAGQPSTPPQSAVLRMIARPLAAAACPKPDDVVSPGPTVVVSDANGRAVQGAAVTFRADGGGQLERTTVSTDASGIASAGTWRLASQPGSNLVVASLATGPSVSFQVIAKTAARVIAAFDLESIGGQPLPITYPVTGTVTGGHYVLADDGTYQFGYVYNGAAFAAPSVICTTAHYVIGTSGIEFYLAPGSYPGSSFYQQLNGHFATATVSNGTMSVKYEDFIDFEDEIYDLEAGFDLAAQLDRVGQMQGVVSGRH